MQRKKTEPNVSTYLHAKGAKLGLPIGGIFELTARCNFKCPMCYVHMSEEQVKQSGRELTAKEWIEIARHAKEQGTMFILLTGGEPFIRKDFFEIYDAMRAMGLMISINSNGSMLDGEIRERLLENPPFRINISLYGGSNDTYCKMCGQPAFDKVVENIRALKTAGVDVSINLSITPYNREDIEKIYKVSQELNVPIKGSSYMYPAIRVNDGQYGCGNRLSAEEAAQCAVKWDLLRFTSEEFRLRAINMKQFAAVEEKDCVADLEEGVKCRAGSTSFWMTWDGKMRPCGMMPWPTAYPMEVGFEAAWEKIRKEVRKLHTPSKCISCVNRKLCFVCAAVCVTETGAFDQVPEYVCRQTEETIRLTWEACQERNKKDGTEKRID